jgi:Cellulase (glycosyl hydrolase family 5)
LRRFVTRLTTPLTVAAALVAALAIAPAAHAARGLEVAIEDEDVFVTGSHYSADKGYQQLTKLGVSRMRVVVGWANVLAAGARSRRPPRKVRYDWRGLDNVVASSAARGIKVQFTVAGPAPAWATGDHRIGPNRPDPAAFGRFATDLAEHFKGKVDRYSIWNEPNYPSWLAPQATAPQQYRALYQAGYKAIKAVDRTNQVLIGETVPFAANSKATAPLAFLRALFCAGCAKLQADGFAHHPYDFDHAPNYAFPGADNVTIGTLGRLTTFLDGLSRRRLLTTPSGGPMPLYLTEFGYFASGRRAFPIAKRRRYLIQAFQIAARNARVRELVQYLLVAPPPKFPFNTALLDASGKPLATFSALSTWAQGAIKAGQAAAPQSTQTPAAPSPPKAPPTTTTPPTTTSPPPTSTTGGGSSGGTGGASPGP